MTIKKKTFLYAVCTGFALLTAACSDDYDVTPQGEDPSLVRFDVQVKPLDDGTLSRVAIQNGNHRMPMQGRGASGLMLVERTTQNAEAINALTRGDIQTAITKDFTTLGYRGTSATTLGSTPWIYNRPTNRLGVLKPATYWQWSQPFGRFFGIYPEVSTMGSGVQLSGSDYSGTPYIDFEVKEDITKQEDLMTATTNIVEYNTQGAPPVPKIVFNHALTAIQIAVGQNLSWDKNIDRVELRNVLYKGRYTLAEDETKESGTWDLSKSTARRNFVLSGLAVDTKKDPNTVLVGKQNDHFTFFMLPQQLTGNNVQLYVHTVEGDEINVTLTGNWEPGMLKTYKISNRNSNWDYDLTVTPSIQVPFTVGSTSFTVKSYRTAPNKGLQPVAWELVGYDNNGDDTFSMDEKPSWVKSLGASGGNGSTQGETVAANLTIDTEDLSNKENQKLKQATPLGTRDNPYNLASNGTTNTTQNTANTYLISAPGFYKLPLVYGNAIKDGGDNKQAYAPGLQGRSVWANFKDHAGRDITSPYINVQNRENPATAAKLMWSDMRGLVHNLGFDAGQAGGDGTDAYVTFEVTQADIQMGNALVAVTNAEGTVMWSWHLWFTPQDVRETTKVTNYQGKVYHFLKEPLGTKFSSLMGSTYREPRSVRVKIRQTQGGVGPREESVFTITQMPGWSHAEGYSTYYQQGRKDPMSGTDNVAEGSFTKNDQRLNPTYVDMIQNPDKMLAAPWNPTGLVHNTWSALATNGGLNDDNNVKTIYDPSPVGFKVPASNAFTFTTKTGIQARNNDDANTADQNVNSTLFWNAVNNPDGTIFLYAGGARSSWQPSSYGNLLGPNRSGYWTASTVENNASYAHLLYLRDDQRGLSPRGDNQRYTAYPILPVTEDSPQ